MARNILEDIKNDLGYYYVNEQYDLNDFVLLIAFVFLAVAMGVVEVIYSYKGKTVMDTVIFIVLGIVFATLFIAHFLIKTVKIIMFRNKKSRYMERGVSYRGKIISEKRGGKIFDDKITGKEKYMYYPTVEYYCNGECIRETSRYAFSNSYEIALRDVKVTIYKYKNDIILTDISEACKREESVAYVKGGGSLWFYTITKKLEDAMLPVIMVGTCLIYLIIFLIRAIVFYFTNFA